MMKVTIVTPSFNQSPFLERTIASVVSQRGEFELEYIVVDGGSTDGTLDILRRRSAELTWTSEPDGGQSDAINKGFSRASGEVVAWLNSDDVYVPGAIDRVVRELQRTGAQWCFGQCRIIDDRDREIRRAISSYKNWLSRRYSWRRLLTKDFVPQPATFFRRDLLARAGPLDPVRHYAMDYDLWLRFAKIAEPVFIPEDLACFRWHSASKSGRRYVTAAMEALGAARQHAGPQDRAPILWHYAHVASLAAGYRVLDLADAAQRAVIRRGS